MKIRMMSYGLWIACIFFASGVAAAPVTPPNVIADNHSEKAAKIEQIIQQHLELLKEESLAHVHPVFLKDFGTVIRNPFVNLPASQVEALTKEGLDLNAMSRYKARYISGHLTGSDALKIINTDPETIMVVGTDTVTHSPLFSRGPIVLVGDVYLMDAIYGKSLVWYGDLARSNGGSPNIGLPVITPSDDVASHSLGVSPYSAEEEIAAVLARVSDQVGRDLINDFSIPIDNPFKMLTPQQRVSLKAAGVDIAVLSKMPAVELKIEGPFPSGIVNHDPELLIVLPENVLAPAVFSRGPILSFLNEISYSLISNSVVFLKRFPEFRDEDVRGSHVVLNPFSEGE